MSSNRVAIFVDSFHNGTPQTFVPADGTGKKIIITAGANGSLVVSIAAVSNDLIDHGALMYLNDGGSNDYLIGAIKIPAGAGASAAVAAVNLLATAYIPWLNVDGEFVLKATWAIKLAMAEAVGTGRTVTIAPFVGDY